MVLALRTHACGALHVAPPLHHILGMTVRCARNHRCTCVPAPDTSSRGAMLDPLEDSAILLKVL